MTTWTKGIVCVYYLALVNADGCDGFTISGEGVVDGHGAGIWEEFWAKRAAARKGEGEYFELTDLVLENNVLNLSCSSRSTRQGVLFFIEI